MLPAGLAAAARAGLPIASPENVGLSSSRLQRLTDWQQRLVEEGQLPCASTLLARDGKVCYWEQCGEQNPGVALGSNGETIFRIYSMGQWFVRAAGGGPMIQWSAADARNVLGPGA